MQGFVHKHCTLRSIVFNKSYAPDLSGCLSHLTHKVLQGDAYTGNWLSAIRHTPKLASRIVVYHNELGCRAISWQDTRAVNGPRHAVIHWNTLPHCNMKCTLACRKSCVKSSDVDKNLSHCNSKLACRKVCMALRSSKQFWLQETTHHSILHILQIENAGKKS